MDPNEQSSMSTERTVNLFVSSYTGSVTTFSVTKDAHGCFMRKVAHSTDCGPRATWLTMNHEARVLFCLNEGVGEVEASLNSFIIKDDGSLQMVRKSNTLSHPVSGAIYNRGKNLALAHYRGSGVTSWMLSAAETGQHAPSQTLTYTLSQPGPNASRQKAPHCHEVVVDPTGQYVLVTDLGAHLVRVYGFRENGDLVTKTPLSVAPGSGPRDAIFVVPEPSSPHEPVSTYLVVVTEMANTVTSYAVTYLPNLGGLKFEQVFTCSTHGDIPLPNKERASELALSPDGRFIVVANRNWTPNLTPAPVRPDGTALPINSLSTFSVNNDGTLTFMQLASCYGAHPQQFAMNQAGDLVAVSLQRDRVVVLLERDVETGLIGNAITAQWIDGDVTCVRWDEKTSDGTNANI